MARVGWGASWPPIAPLCAARHCSQPIGSRSFPLVLSLMGHFPLYWPHTGPSLLPHSVPAQQGPPHGRLAWPAPPAPGSLAGAHFGGRPAGGALAAHLPWAAARSFRQVRSPLTAAWCRGRAPSRVSRVAAWPSRSSHCTSRGCPKRAARCSGETPESSWSYWAKKGRWSSVAGWNPSRQGSPSAQDPATLPTCSSLPAG